VDQKPASRNIRSLSPTRCTEPPNCRITDKQFGVEFRRLKTQNGDRIALGPCMYKRGFVDATTSFGPHDGCGRDGRWSGNCNPPTTAVRFRIHSHDSYCHVLCRVERRLFLGCDRFDGRADALLWPAKIVYPPAVVLPPHTPLCRAFTAASHASRIAAILETSGSILESGEFTCASTMTKPIGDPNLRASQPLVRRQLFRMRFLRRLVGYVSVGGNTAIACHSAARSRDVPCSEEAVIAIPAGIW
jgi:hypothetical protein